MGGRMAKSLVLYQRCKGTVFPKTSPFTNGYLILKRDKMMLKIKLAESALSYQFVCKKTIFTSVLFEEDCQLAVETKANITDISNGSANSGLTELKNRAALLAQWVSKVVHQVNCRSEISMAILDKCDQE